MKRRTDETLYLVVLMLAGMGLGAALLAMILEALGLIR